MLCQIPNTFSNHEYSLVVQVKNVVSSVSRRPAITANARVEILLDLLSQIQIPLVPTVVTISLFKQICVFDCISYRKTQDRRNLKK